MEREKFSEFISKLRKEKGMTQQDLGDKLHLTNKTISKWEQGVSFPDLGILEDLAKALDVTILELLKGERNTEKEISAEAANRIIGDTVKHSSELIKRIRRRLTIAITVIIGLFPLLLMFFSGTFFYLLKDEKSLDDALLTLIFLFIAGIILFIMYGVPLLGLIFVKRWCRSSLMSRNKKLKRFVCISLCSGFGIWLIFVAIRVAGNLIRW